MLPQLDDVTGGQEPEAVVVPRQGGDAAVGLEGGRLHPPVVEAALVAGWYLIFVICGKRNVILMCTDEAKK